MKKNMYIERMQKYLTSRLWHVNVRIIVQIPLDLLCVAQGGYVSS